MSNQFRYMKGDTKSKILRAPSKAVMLGQTAPAFLSSGVQFAIQKGDLLFQDPVSGCVFPAWLLSYTGTTYTQASAAAWQGLFASLFVGIADERIGLVSGEFSPNPNLMYQDTVKVATGGVWEMDCPNQVFPNSIGPVGICATASGIANAQYAVATSATQDAQTVDQLYGANTTTTGAAAVAAPTLAVASVAGISVGSVLSVATTGSAATQVTANVGTVIPASGTGVAGTSTGSAFIPILTGAGIGPGTVLEVATTTPAGVEEVYVSSVAGSFSGGVLQYAITTSQTTLYFSVLPSGIALGCALMIGNELMVVTGFNPGATPYPTVTVGTRGSAGTAQGFGSTAATAAAAAAVTVYPMVTVTRAYNGTTAGTISASAVVTPVSTPPEQVLVTAINSLTLTVTRNYNGTGTGVASTAYAVISGAIVTVMGTNMLQRIGTIDPTMGMQRQIENGQPQNRVCVEIKPNLIAGGTLVSP